MANRKQDKGIFIGIFDSSPDDFFTIATVRSDGRDFTVEIPEPLIPFINQLCIDHACNALKDAFYRVRPDLREQ